MTSKTQAKKFKVESAKNKAGKKAAFNDNSAIKSSNYTELNETLDYLTSLVPSPRI